MVSVVNGSGLGLFNTRSSTSAAGLGQTREQIFVNGTNGNLVIQDLDESINVTGLDLDLVRTYNSLGVVDGDNNDNWKIGVYRQVRGLTGTVNTVGSRVTKVFGDAAEVVYTFAAASGSNPAGYYSGDGDGARDKLTFNGSQWTWTDGSSRTTETYDSSGKLLNMKDADGNTISYGYNAANLLTQITSVSPPAPDGDGSTQTVLLNYVGTNLQSIQVSRNGAVQTLTSYAYDAANRLSAVRVDLTPADSADNKVYTTTYTYDGSSKRIASITQSDGTTIAFTYYTGANAGKLNTYTDGAGKVTTLTYTATTANLPASATVTSTGLLTPPTGWGAAGVRESLPAAASGAQMQFDKNGNGIAIWAQGTTLMAIPYDKNSRNWGTAASISGTLTTNVTTPQLSMSANGGALATWVQNGNVYARRLINGVWDNAALTPLETAAAAAANPVGAINDNGRAVVAFVQSGNLMVNVFNGTAWQGAVALDDQGAANASAVNATVAPSVTVDPSGNVGVLWLQKLNSGDAGESLYFSRYNGTGWSNPDSTLLESGSAAVTAAQIDFDGSGNGVAAFVQGGALNTRSFTLSTGRWSTNGFPGGITGASAPSLAVSANGTALLSWAQTSGSTTNVVASVYAGGAWSSAQVIEALGGAASNTVSAINDAGQGVVSFVQNDGSANRLYATRHINGAWEAVNGVVTATRIDSPNTIAIAAGMVPSVTIDRLGDIDVVWGQKAAAADAGDSVYSARLVTDLTPYYQVTVTASTTWQTIANDVYGDSTAGSALQAWLGNIPIGSVGDTMKITVPPRLDFIKSVAVNRVDITDPLNQLTSYFIDTATGLLRQVQSPPPVTGAARPTTSFLYDANGNVVETIDGNGNVTTSSYDGNDNLLSVRDALGNTVAYAYDANNQLTTETRYLVPDPDASGVAQPAQPLVTRHVYDGENHLRFSISADGRVTEYRYDRAGNAVAVATAGPGRLTAQLQYTAGLYTTAGLPTESQMVAWVTGQGARLERTDYAYDFRGNTTSVTAWASIAAGGNGVNDGNQSVTQFVYDQRGNLLQTLDPRANGAVPNPANASLPYATTYVYDGLGRVLSTTQWVDRNLANVDKAVTALTNYDDVNHRIVTTLANGLATTTTYDARGLVVSASQANGALALGTTTFQYDADGNLRITTDPLGHKSYRLYDAADRLVAEIDATGAMVENTYDNAGNVVRRTAYAAALTTANLASLVDGSGNPSAVTADAVRPALDAANDRVTRALYDAANRLVMTIESSDANNANGYVTRNFYDGAGRLTDIMGYATAVALPAAPSLANVTALIKVSPDDRHARNFYDADGDLIGALDGEGALCEYRYDGAGETTQTICYATTAPAAMRSSGTLAALMTAVNPNPANPNPDDQHSYTFYDAKGQISATLDALGYLTEFQYDKAGNQTLRQRWANLARPYTGTQTQAELRPQADGNDDVTVTTYDGANRVTFTDTTSGNATRYVYDDVGNLTEIDRAWDTSDQRSTWTRYDSQGRVLQELTPNGRVLVMSLGSGATQTEVDLLWSQHGVTYTYDMAGNRLSATDPNGNRTLYYYDAADRLRYTVNALGEVTETRYNAFGEVSETFQYTGRIPTTSGAWSPVNLLAAGVAGGQGGIVGLQTVFDKNGNGIAVYLQSGNYVVMREYVAATATWGAAVGVSDDNSVSDPPSLAMSDNGNVILAWTDGGEVDVAWRVDGVWSGIGGNVALGTGGGLTSGVYASAAINDAGDAAVVFLQSDGTRKNIVGARFRNGVWFGVEVIDDNNSPNNNSITATVKPAVTVNPSGEVGVLWLQKIGADALDSLCFSSYDYWHDDWSPAPTVIARNTPVTGLQIATGGDGTTLAAWSQGGILSTASLNLKDSAFTSGTSFGVIEGSASLAMNQGGAAILAFSQGNNMLAAMYANGAWAAQTIETLAGVAINPVASINDNGQAAVAFVQNTGTVNHVFANRYVNGAWQGAAQLENSTPVVSAGTTPRVAMSHTGDITVMWLQTPAGQSLDSAYFSRFTTNGGPVTATLTAAVAAIATPAMDAHSKFNYTLRGAIKDAIEARDGNSANDLKSSYAYNAFGDVATELDPVINVAGASNTATSTLTTRLYDHRGFNVKTIEDDDNGGVVGIKLSTSVVYDAFGRVIQSVDGNGNLHSARYDRLGRAVVVTDPNGDTTSTYDAFDRVLTRRDALGNQVATYAYNDATRSFILTTAEGIQTTTTTTRLDQIATVTDGRGNVSGHAYDADGNLILESTSSPDGSTFLTSSHAYDGAGQLVRTTDPRGIHTNYSYDAAGRVLTRTVDPASAENPGGVNLVTRYGYDGQGRTLTVTDPNGVVTQMTYDAKGQVTQTAVDPTGLNLRTSYTYDASGRSLTIVGGAGSANPVTTQHVYDNLGRRIETHVDPAGFNLTTRYAYDKDDNVTQVTDPNGNVTRYYYDGADRQIYVLDALNGLTQTVYDADGRVIKQISYATPLTGGGFPASPAKANIDARIAAIADATRDDVTFAVYDKDGRQVYGINALGEVTQSAYDANGNVVRSTHFGVRIDLASLPAQITPASVDSLVNATMAALGSRALPNEVEYAVYDGVDRQVYSINSLGEVTATTYDNDGNILQLFRWGVRLDMGALLALPGGITGESVGIAISQAVSLAGSAALPNVRTTSVYDGANRQVYSFNALGELSQYFYDGNGNVTRSVQYANRITFVAQKGPLRPAHVAADLISAGGPDPARDIVSNAVYDAADRLIETSDALGAVTRMFYDANGNVVKTVEYANARNPSGVVLANAASDVVTYGVYDAANRRIYAFNSLGELTRNFYDANGNVIKTIEYGNRITASYYRSPPTATSWQTVAATLYGVNSAAAGLALQAALFAGPTPPISGVITFAALPPVLTVGGATFNLKVELLAENNTAALVGAQITSNTTSDLVSYKVYDAVDREVYEFNAQGEVTQNFYDANGNVIKTIEYANRIVPAYYQLPATSTTWQAVAATLYGVSAGVAGQALQNALGAGPTPPLGGRLNVTALPAWISVGGMSFYLNIAVLTDNNTVAQVSALVSPNAAADLVEYSVYDAAGRQTFSINALGEVAQNVYDTSGKVIKNTQYANRIAIPQAISASSIATAITLAGVNFLGDRVSHAVYDAAGRLIYGFNSLGEATQTVYDTNGNVVNRVDYATRISASYYQLPATATTWQAVANTLYGVNSAAAGTALRTAVNGGATPPLSGKLNVTALPPVLTVGTSTFNLNTATLTDNNTAALVSAQLVDTALDEISRYVYDGAGRVIFTVTGQINGNEGATVVEYTYDAAGHVTRTKGYSVPIFGAWLPTQPIRATELRMPNVLWTNAQEDRVQYQVYDAAGRVAASVTVGASEPANPDHLFGDVVALAYDARGNVVSRTTYARRIDMNTWVVGTMPTPVADSAHDRRVRTLYDAAGRVSYVLTDATDWSSGLNIRDGVARFAYDAHGNVIDSVAYANTIDNSTVLNKAALDAAQSSNVADRRERFVYDSANRLVYGVDGVGAVTQTVYDAHGQVIKLVEFATAIAATAAPGSVASSPGNDRISVMTYDAAGRRIYLLDALGGLSQNTYDSRGNVVQFMAYAQAIAPPTLAASYTTASVTGAITTGMRSDPGNRLGYSLYDTANRQILNVDALGAVIQNQYDAFGNAIQTTAYAVPVDLSGVTPANAAALLPGRITSSADDRVARCQFDVFNQCIASMDALGYVKTTVYDLFGQVASARDYAVAVPRSTSPENIRSALFATPGIFTGMHFYGYAYDQAGRLLWADDPLGYTERNTYDGTGNKITFTNKNGAVWSYDYDAAGNMIKETTPQVGLTALTQTGALGSLRVDAAHSGVASVVSIFVYDALGNLTVRNEAVGRPEQRGTTYSYDALGRQVRTSYGLVGVYDFVNDSLTTNGATPWQSNTTDPSGIAVRVEQLRSLFTDVTYDALGNAISNLDVAGNRSYKTYDVLGQVAYEFDAMGGVTGHARNTFGEVTALTRHAAAQPTMLTGTGQTSLTTAQKQALAGAGDRTITTVYDALGRAVLVTEPAALNYDPDLAGAAQYFTAGKTTRTTYDAFGNIVQVAQLKRPDQWEFVLTNYYDLKDQRVAQVDALGSLTMMRYDAFGNLTRRYDFLQQIFGWDGAHPLAFDQLDPSVDNQIETDPFTDYTYDALNRLISKNDGNVLSEPTDVFGNLIDDGVGLDFRDCVTSYGYDAVGNQTRMTDAVGGETYTYYDALGRVIAVVSPKRMVATSTDDVLTNPSESTFVGMPLTEYKLDALGNVLVKYEYAFGADELTTQQAYVLPSDQTRRTTLSKYDSGGHVTQATDAGGINHYSSFNELGELAKTWQQQTVFDGASTARTSFQAYRYDKLGRLTDTLDPASIYVLQTATRPAATVTQTLTNTPGRRDDTDHTLRLTWANVVDVRVGAGNVRVAFTFAGAARQQDFTASGITQLSTGTSVVWTDFAAAGTVTNLVISQQITDGSGNTTWVSLWPTNNSPLGFTVATQTQAQAGLTDTLQTYNTFGEITAKGQRPWLSTQTLQETFEYDNAGRLWRTNSGDGALKVMLYDLQGRATAKITSVSDGDTSWTTSTLDEIARSTSFSRSRTDMYYDAMGHLIKTVLPTQLVRGGMVSLTQDGIVMSGTPVSATAAFDSSLQGVIWTGNNEVDVTAFGMPLTDMGSGDIKVVLDYTTLAYTVSGPDRSGRTTVTVSGAGVGQQHSQVFAAHEPLHVIWKDPPGGSGGVSAVSHISVYKRDLYGTWLLLAEQFPGNNAVSPKNVIWVSAPSDPTTVVGLELIQNGVVTDVTTSMIWTFGDLMRFDASGLVGSYTYRTMMNLTNGTRVTTATGTLTAPPLTSIGTNVTISAGTVTLTAPAADVPTFAYRPAGGSGAWSAATTAVGATVGGNRTWTANLSSLAAGSYEYELLFYGGVPRRAYSHATGTVTVTGTTTKTFAINKTTPPNSGAISVRWDDTAGAAGRVVTQDNFDTTQLRPVIELTVDRYGNVLSQSDPRSAGYQTHFGYTKGGQVDNQGTSLNGLSYTFDMLGRRISTRGGSYQLFDAGNNLVTELHADTGVVRYFYDIFGDRVATRDAMGNMSGATYDDLGRISQTKFVDARGINIVNQFGYDEKGNRALQINYNYGQYDRITGQGFGLGQEGFITYRYDLMGNVQEVRKAGGGSTKAVYDGRGNQIYEVDANGNLTSATYDYFGRLLTRVDIGGATTTYGYSRNSGLLNGQTSTRGENISFFYDHSGRLLQEMSSTNNSPKMSIAYDLAGNRVREKTTAPDGRVLQDNHILYDVAGRMSETKDTRTFIHVDYDGADNRTYIETRAFGLHPDENDVPEYSFRHFAYDPMNRQVVVDANGVNPNADWGSEAQLGRTGHAIKYDLNGNRIEDITWRDESVVTHEGSVVLRNEGSNTVVFDPLGNVRHSDTTYAFVGGGMRTDRYVYDERNNLEGVIRDGSLIDYRLYDLQGRALTTGGGMYVLHEFFFLTHSTAKEFGELLVQAGHQGLVSGLETRWNTYDADGNLTFQYVYGHDSKEIFDIDYSHGYDLAGNLRHYQMKAIEDPNAWNSGHPDGERVIYTNTYDYTLARFAGYQVKQIVGTSTEFDSGTTTNFYDASGNLIKTEDAQQASSTRSFVNDVGGRPLYATQNGNVQRQLIVNGQVLGRYGTMIDESRPRDENGKPVFETFADFNFSYQPVTPAYPTPTPGNYTVRSGDTLRSIAQGAYGDSALWYVIADANGLIGDEVLHPGQRLSIPNHVESVHNNASTYTPYNPTHILGDQTPFLPKGESGCGGWGLFLAVTLAVAVAVAISILTYGAAAPALAGALGSVLGAIVAGAAAGAAASIGSQLVLLATGVQDDFSGDQVLKGALFGAIGGGLSAAMSGATQGLQTAAQQASTMGAKISQTIGLAVEQAAIAGTANIVGQGIATITHLQKEFRWGDVALAATSSGVGGLARAGMNNVLSGMGEGFTKQLLGQTVSNLAANTAGALARGGKIDYTLLAADSFGNALGGATVQSAISAIDDTRRREAAAFRQEALERFYGAQTGKAAGLAAQESSDRTSYEMAMKRFAAEESQATTPRLSSDAFNDGSHAADALAVDISQLPASMERRWRREHNVPEVVQFEDDHVYGRRQLPKASVNDASPPAFIRDGSPSRSVPPPATTTPPAKTALDHAVDSLKEYLIHEGQVFANIGKGIYHQMQQPGAIVQDIVERVVYIATDGANEAEVGIHSDLFARLEAGSNQAEEIIGAGLTGAMLGAPGTMQAMMAGYGVIEGLVTGNEEQALGSFIGALPGARAATAEIRAANTASSLGKSVAQAERAQAASSGARREVPAEVRSVQPPAGGGRPPTPPGGGRPPSQPPGGRKDLPARFAERYPYAKRLADAPSVAKPRQITKFEPKLSGKSPAERKAYLKEYNDQLSRQQEALNLMTVDKFLEARAKFDAHGRDNSQRTFGRRFKNEVAKSIEKTLRERDPNMRRAEARKIARAQATEIRSTLAALHEPDSVIGGTKATRMGPADVNSALGGSWGDKRSVSSRLAQLDRYAREMQRNQLGGAKMNVRFGIEAR